MKVRAIDYSRNTVGEHLTVMLEPEWLGRLFGVKPRRQTYSRRIGPSQYGNRWFTGGLPTPLSMQQELTDLRDAWEHDNTDWDQLAEERLGRRQLPELWECDCGRQHPAGAMCLGDEHR
jgi:hypothetical protein